MMEIITEAMRIIALLWMGATIAYFDVILTERSKRRKAAERRKALAERRHRRELFRSHGVPENRNPYVGPASR